MNAKFVYENINFEKGIESLRKMDIGILYSIKNWLKYHEIPIYIINDNLSINIPDTLYVEGYLSEFPSYINIRKVSSMAFLNDLGLKSLRGGPRIVEADFFINNNKLESLEYSPIYVYGDYYCGNNPGNFSEKDVLSVCEVKGKIYTD